MATEFDYILFLTGNRIIRASRLRDAARAAGFSSHVEQITRLMQHGTRYANEDFDVLSAAWAGLGWPDLSGGVR